MTFTLGPPLLVLLRWIYPLDWDPLSSVGQSYTGISALLSAGALVAVALSIRYQARDTRLSHTLAIHDSQRELVRLALDDTDLLPCINASEEVAERRRLYNTLWLRYYELAYSTGHISADSLAFVLEHERFVVPLVRDHWKKVSSLWRNAGPPDFVAIVEGAYSAALRRHESDGEPSPTDD
jgi:hypothetical protein